MEQRLRNESTSFSGTEDWRNRSNLMSISELFSELRDTFIGGDFDLVEKTLIDREERLKKEIEEKKKELELAEERMKFEKLERVTLEFKLERLQAEINKKVSMNKNGKERGDAGAVKNHLVTDDDGVASAGVEKASQNVGVLLKEKKGVDEQSNKHRLSASALEFRKTTLKEALEEKVVGKLEDNNKFKSWGMIDVGVEVMTDTKKRRGGEATATELLAEKVDVLDETLVVRKAMLKSVVEETLGELEENNHFKSLGKINYEIVVKTVVEKSCEFGLDDGKFVKAGVGQEKCKFEVLKNRGVGNGSALALAPAELVGEKVKVLAEKKRFVGASDTEWQSSSGAVQKNLDTRLAKPTAIPPGDAMRKAAIAEKIMLLQKKNQFKSSGRLSFDGEGVTVNGESCGEKLVKDGKVVNAKLGDERCKPEILKNSGVGVGEASAVAKLKDEKVEVLAETKRLAGEPSKKDDLGSSGKEQKNSSGVVQEDLATKLVESIGIKRGFPCTDLDFLNNLDSSDSSSSSSSSDEDEFDMVISNKKMRTNVSQSTNGLY
ncbi:hypothetical protein QL285_012337 [Trifolium repens]|nr:hypothetical protein QL285_012337 [Trifolium repens]